jgi:hypothetical protein
MKMLLSILAVAFLGGCATQSEQAMAAVRAAGVAPRTVSKLEHRGVLEPSDLIELRRRGVDDAVPIRQLDKVGVDYVVQRDDFRKLRAAGVRPAVNDALLEASREFVEERYRPRGSWEVGFSPWDLLWLANVGLVAWGYHDYYHHHHGHHHHGHHGRGHRHH